MSCSAAIGACEIGRKSKIPPPPLSTSTIVSFSSRRAAASRPPMSWASATSPISSTTGPSAFAAAPNALETIPSIPFAPRLQSTRGGSSRAGQKVSISRTGIEEATNSVAVVGQQRAELRGDRRLAELLAGTERAENRLRRLLVGGAPAGQPVRIRGGLRRCRARRGRRPAPARATRSGSTPGPARRPRGRAPPAGSRRGPRATCAAAWRRAGRRRESRDRGRRRRRTHRRAAARRSGRSPPSPGARRRGDRPAAASRPPRRTRRRLRRAG